MGRQVNKNTPDVAKSASCDHDEGIMIMSASQPSSDRIIFLSGDVNEHTISSIITQLISLASSNSSAPIHLIVSTYGGSVDEMFSLYDTIKFLPCPVYTIALGKVMSAGVLLLASGTKGKRMIGKNARIMIHSISGAAHGNIFEVMNDSKEMQRQQDLMMSALLSESKMTQPQIEKIMKMGHDYYLTPEEAIKLGIVDKIIGS
jgi:ATP-dependent Clp protease protease subunit